MTLPQLALLILALQLPFGCLVGRWMARVDVIQLSAEGV